MGAARRFRGEIFAHSPFAQLRKTYRASLPLFPDRRPKPTPEPAFKLLQHKRRFALSEVAEPAPQIACQLLGHSLRAHPARPPRQFSDLLLASQHRLRRNPPFRFPMPGKTKAQKLPLPWPRHRTLLFVHLELELPGEEAFQAFHHSLPRPPATDVHVTVIRIPREPETSPLQLPVELVEYDVTEQGR